MSIYLGAEYRKSRINDTPPDDSINGNLLNLSSAAPTRGSDSVWEMFGEVALPILSKVPMAYDLSLTGSARYTHYRSYGGGTTWKVAGVYAPAKMLQFRGNIGTSYRAPALFEQFLGGTTGFISQQNDPCNNFGAEGTSAVVAANCASENLPNGGDFVQNNGIKVVTAGGADQGLEEETSKSWSIGTVIEPSLGKLGDLSLAADYFRTEVSNGVSRAGAVNILSFCYEDPEFKAGGGFCNFLSRDPNSFALTVNNNFVNLATDIVRGIDFNVRYQVPVGTGTLRLGVEATRFFEQSNKLFDDEELVDANGTIATPRWSAVLDANYNVGKFDFHWGVDWIGKTSSYKIEEVDPDTDPFFFETPHYFLHNASVRYNSGPFGITVGVRNLFDKNPPQVSSGGVLFNRVANAPLFSGYDYVGRTFFVNVSAAVDELLK